MKTCLFGIKYPNTYSLLTINFLFSSDLFIAKTSTFFHVKQKCIFYVVGNSESKRSKQSMEMLIRNGEANIDSDDEVDLFNVQTDRHER